MPSSQGWSPPAEFAFRNGIALSGKFDGEFANRTRTYAGTATLRYGW